MNAVLNIVLQHQGGGLRVRRIGILTSLLVIKRKIEMETLNLTPLKMEIKRTVGRRRKRQRGRGRKGKEQREKEREEGRKIKGMMITKKMVVLECMLRIKRLTWEA